MLPAAVAAVVFGGLLTLYTTGRVHAFEETLRWFGVDPFRFPFVDVETVLSAVRCLRAGVDVLAGNPCDPLRRVFDYSPLWLVLAKFPVTEAWTNPAGLLLGVAYLASLLLLPAGRSLAAAILIAVGGVSSAVVFAIERGNNDLVLFALATGAATLSCRAPGLRLVGYALAMLAGLLKYYPLTLMSLAARERPARFAAVTVASLVIVAVFLLTMGHDLVRALKLIPIGGWFGDMFGSSTLPGGLSREYGLSPGVTSALRVSLSVIALGAGLVIALRPSLTAAFERLTDLERATLLAGGLLILSCFFTAQNIGYRALHLVLTLPALTAMSTIPLRSGWLWRVTTGTVLALLWAQGWRNWFLSQDEGRPVFIGGWLLREALWWWTITMMIALVAGLLVRSEIGRRIIRLRNSPA